jgi:hypothetical protein
LRQPAVGKYLLIHPDAQAEHGELSTESLAISLGEEAIWSSHTFSLQQGTSCGMLFGATELVATTDMTALLDLSFGTSLSDV